MLLWDQEEEETSNRTKTAETVDYLCRKGVRCVAVKNGTEQTRKGHGRSYSHDQKFIVIDEPMLFQNEEVRVSYGHIYLTVKIFIFIKNVSQYII